MLLQAETSKSPYGRNMHGPSGTRMAIFPRKTSLSLSSGIQEARYRPHPTQDGHVEWIRILLGCKLLRFEGTSLAQQNVSYLTNTDFREVAFSILPLEGRNVLLLFKNQYSKNRY